MQDDMVDDSDTGQAAGGSESDNGNGHGQRFIAHRTT